MRRNRWLCTPLAIAVFAAGSVAQDYSDIYVFGDSLSDNGNLFAMTGVPGEPYWEGRFSNGRVWVEPLARVLGIRPREIEDFAVGGSTTTMVLENQVLPLISMSGGALPSDALYVYWAGSNDLLDVLAGGGDPQAAIQLAMLQTASAITALVQAGARTVMVANLPNFAHTPRVRALNDPVATAGAEALAAAYNQALGMVLGQLELAFGLDFVELDTFALMNDVVADPLKYELRRVDRPVIRSDGTLRPRQWRFLFFDDIHPTRVGHRLVMRAGLRELGIPIPGDLNGDFIVNREDLRLLRRSFGFCCVGCPADLNGDGRVGYRDQKILARMIGRR